MAREREALLRALLPRALPAPLSRRRVLDVGCGRGDLLGWLSSQGVPTGNLTGLDISRHRVVEARRRHPGIDFQELNAGALQPPLGSFDLVTCFTLFSSLLDPVLARRVAGNVAAVLKDGGSVLWYDIRYPNPWNRAVRSMTRPRIQELFGDFELELRSVTLVPQLARRLGPASGLYALLAAIPPLRTHYMGLLQRRGEGT
jgi:SAM-dependent methyltransferase